MSQYRTLAFNFIENSLSFHSKIRGKIPKNLNAQEGGLGSPPIAPSISAIFGFDISQMTGIPTPYYYKSHWYPF